MKKYVKYLLFLFFTTTIFAETSIFEDFAVTESVMNLNLGGHTVKVEESGVVLEKCTNGVILVASSVETGLVTLKNCKNISVVVEGDSCVLIDSKSEIDYLLIKGNALVDSLDVFLADVKGKKNSQKKKPLIKRTDILSTCSPFLKNCDFEETTVIHSEKEKSKSVNHPKIVQDMSYKGYGVRFIIENSPKEADCLYVLLKEGETEKEIAWISPEANESDFYTDAFEYEFLEAGKEYEFVFWYALKQETLVKYYVKATAKKGFAIEVNNKNAKINIDEKTGMVSWESMPSAKLPEGSTIVYEIISLDKKFNWLFIGSRTTDYKNFNSFNIYENVDWLFPERIVDNTVFLHIYYQYKTNRWQIIGESQHIKVKK